MYYFKPFIKVSIGTHLLVYLHHLAYIAWSCFFPVITKVLSHSNIHIYNFLKRDSHVFNAYHIRKLHKLPNSSYMVKADEPLTLVHSNIWVSPNTSNNGYNYYIHSIKSTSYEKIKN